MSSIESWIDNSYHESTDFTPYELMYGKIPKCVIETLINFPPQKIIPLQH